MSTQQPDTDSTVKQFERLLDRFYPKVEEALNRFAWPGAEMPPRLREAMDYSLLAGGKRLRPILVLAACEAVGGDPITALPVAAAFEMVHTYSLIHDDLPAMDDDDLRRGRPTCHVKFGDATAILAGDGMMTFAFQSIAEGIDDPGAAIAVIRELSRAAGVEGMVGGQQADLESEGDAPDLERLRYIHRRKTGALIIAAVVCGAIVGGADKATIEALKRYGADIGLAFQVVDDILDLTATAEELGKSPGKDRAANKMTYPALMGLEEAKKHAEALVDNAERELESLGEAAGPLRTIARYIVERGN